MKLFAFVRRGRRPPTSPAPPAAAPEDAGPTEKRRRRPSSSSSSSGYAAAWKPTLGAISEDAALTAASAAKTQAKPVAAAKAKPRSSVSPRRAARAATASYDDFRHYAPPTVLPAFSPTAFLF